MPNELLGPDECWLDAIVLWAGLEVPEPIQLAPSVSLEKIFENNLVAQGSKIASEVLLGAISNPEAPLHPVYGMKFRVYGKKLWDGASAQFNAQHIAAPKRAFRRAAMLTRGVDLRHAGTFVYEINGAGQRMLRSYQFNFGLLSVHYAAAYFDNQDADELRAVYGALLDPYLAGMGASIGTAIDRLGSASLRETPVDVNLDLCIAMEIAFLYGLQRDVENEKIAETVRENARVFFGHGEFYWDGDEVFRIAQESYRERSKTIHGRSGDSSGTRRYSDTSERAAAGSP